MSNRLTRIYTRGGDKGTTALANGNRVSKTSARIEALGTVDELNSQLGLLLSQLDDQRDLQQMLMQRQHELFDLGGELAVADEGYRVICAEMTTELERELDALNQQLPALKEFILPGGSPAAAQCHVTRTLCRRAERRLAAVADREKINPEALAYLNRLSDLLFVCCRIIARHNGGDEVLWRPRDKRS
ncbi:cob(I)yrinic acid a,c-diamide adenosyltransferase [Marinobacterium jannaschii]|uniref:cob(I)yrinic acid a,c-diamide adenosyltransferase n=1 Tax=Marinobacterium jannaschii TaxID=64970 RepID=UPI0004821334|nr:cob(I)yrinic acid a,c-diamide adenosyltransferase [Marinobacterium jannaschii]